MPDRRAQMPAQLNSCLAKRGCEEPSCTASDGWGRDPVPGGGPRRDDLQDEGPIKAETRSLTCPIDNIRTTSILLATQSGIYRCNTLLVPARPVPASPTHRPVSKQFGVLENFKSSSRKKPRKSRRQRPKTSSVLFTYKYFVLGSRIRIRSASLRSKCW